MESIKEKSDKSSMRVSLYWIVALAELFGVAICIVLIVQAFKGTEINWNGIALTIGAIGVFIAPAFGFKTLQKKFE